MISLLNRAHGTTPFTAASSSADPTRLCLPSCSTSHRTTSLTGSATCPAFCGGRTRNSRSGSSRRKVCIHAVTAAYPPAEVVKALPTDAPTDVEYDAVIIGSGMGGLTTAARLVANGAKVVVLEK